ADSATYGDASTIEALGLQATLQKAQIASIMAQTEKTEAEADKIKGVDIEKGKVDIEAAKQAIKNAKEQYNGILESIRGQKADNEIKEFNAAIHKYLKENYTTFKEFDGYDDKGNPIMKINRQLYTERVADLIMSKAEKDGLEISTEEKELINRKEIAIKLAQDIDAIAKGELDRLTISTKNLEKLDTEIKRNKYELEQDTAISKMLDDTVGLGEYTRFLGKFINFYFRKK
ncbi:hypothetical protein, partial [Lysinibacillus boronitolerans]|uniref:hypothetical protein n=1 Tax=Lysinibacillus boronitolerans TaxID=309788 RepID=UPI0005634889